MRTNVKELMDKSAELIDDYRIGNECFISSDKGFATLLTFSNKGRYQPRDKYERLLLDELLSESNTADEIEGTYEGKFYYISAFKPSSKHCYRCHWESELDKEFKAFGAIAINVPIDLYSICVVYESKGLFNKAAQEI